MQMKKNKGYLAVQGGVLALLAVGTGAMAEYNTVTGEWRKDQTPPRLYNQQAWVNNFALQLPLGATFAPQMTAQRGGLYGVGFSHHDLLVARHRL